MRAVARSFAVADNEAQVAAAYNQAGYRYAKYADGDCRKLFTFEGRHAYADRKTWEVIETKLLKLKAQGSKRLRVLDLGCGPGLWLRRVVTRLPCSWVSVQSRRKASTSPMASCSARASCRAISPRCRV